MLVKCRLVALFAAARDDGSGQGARVANIDVLDRMCYLVYQTPHNATSLHFTSMVWSDQRSDEELAQAARAAGRFLAGYFKREQGIAKAGSASKGWRTSGERFGTLHGRWRSWLGSTLYGTGPPTFGKN